MACASTSAHRSATPRSPRLRATGSGTTGKRGCLARRSPIGPRFIGRIALGRRRATLRRRIASLSKSSRTERWCVKRSRGRVVAVFARRSRRSVLVTSTATGHRLRRVGPGVRTRALRRAFPRRTRVARGIVRAGPRSRRIFGVRRGKVRWVAVADRRLLRRPSALRRELRRAGLK